MPVSDQGSVSSTAHRLPGTGLNGLDICMLINISRPVDNLSEETAVSKGKSTRTSDFDKVLVILTFL